MIRVGIADGHAIVRCGLRNFLSEQEGICVVGEAGDGRAALELMRSSLHVLVMDLALPGQSGLDALARIRARAPEVAILIFTGYPQEQYAVSLFRQGVSGYLNKSCDLAEIARAVRAVALGRRYITPAIADLMAGQLASRYEAPHERLSERELQVFLKLAMGQSPGVIAHTLSLSVKTVSTYRTRLLEKLQLASNSDLTYYALKRHLLD